MAAGGFCQCAGLATLRVLLLEASPSLGGQAARDAASQASNCAGAMALANRNPWT